MADDQTVDTTVETTPTITPDHTGSVDTAAEPSAESEAPAPARKAPARKTASKPAKKAAAKKAPARKKAAPAADSETAGDAPAGESAPAKPAKKTAAKKTTAKKTASRPAKKTAAKKSAAAPADDTGAPEGSLDGVEPVADPAVEPGTAAVVEDASEAPAGAAVLFQPPAAVPASTSSDEDDEEDEEAADAEGATGSPESEPTGKAAATTDGPETTDGAEGADVAESEDGTSDEDSEGGAPSGNARRRRRRGGRRRRKPAGAGNNGDDAEGDDDTGSADASDSAGDDADAVSADDADGSGADAQGGQDGEQGGEQGQGQSNSSRRRRRRRREGESGDNGNDDPNTVTKVRRQRTAEDEITAVAGSTRLEAKKQRRREGREAGRRRAPIVSEAEFLARRESVNRVMVVRQRKDLTQIAVLEDKILVEHYVARESQTSLIGNVYLGRVQNVLPSMEAAFVDIGKGRNAVLYAGEVNWSALGHKDGAPRKIESVLQSGQTILVQVTKDPIGHKGARLTSQISLAGRFLVYVPDGTTSGISRKLPDTERARLKSLLKEIVPESAGVIVRTAAEGASEDELTRDVERLKARWEDIEAKAANKGANAQLLYGEPDLTLKVVRDLFTEDFGKLVVQGDEAWETVQGYVEHVAPDLADRLEHFQPGDNGQDAFATYRIDEQIAKGLDRKVWLPSGGSLIIDRTEAMTVIDVNTGKFTGSGGNLEETVTKNNLEAAEEIVRQLRLRDIGGIIVVDFIDMVLESNRDLVLRRMVECLGRDRTRHQVAEVTSLGLVQMTRKRIGTGLLEAFSESCTHCQGRGLVVHDLPVEPRRGGSEDEPRRSGRRRGKGKGNDEPTPKAVPSPKDVAAMAKPPTGEEGDAAAEDQNDDKAENRAENKVEVDAAERAAGEAAATEATDVTDSPVETPAAEVVDPVTAQREGVVSGAVAEPVVQVAEPASATEPVGSEADEAGAEPEAAEPAPAEPAAAEPSTTPAPPAPPTVVTRTRRRAASRPAGPPVTADGVTAAAATVVVGEPSTPPEAESNADEAPAVQEASEAPAAEPAVVGEDTTPPEAESHPDDAPAAPSTDSVVPPVGEIGTPVDHGAVEPFDGAVEPAGATANNGSDADVELPLGGSAPEGAADESPTDESTLDESTVEHVPVKKKGARKR